MSEGGADSDGGGPVGTDTDYAFARDMVVVLGIDGRLRSTETFVRFRQSRTAQLAKIFFTSLRSMANTHASSPRDRSVTQPPLPADAAPTRTTTSSVQVPSLADIAIDVNGTNIVMDWVALDGLGRVCFVSPLSGKYADTMTHELLSLFQFRYGHNRLRYTCRFHDTGTTLAAECDVFLWDRRQKLVVFDIDGTITRSDVMGYVETVFLGTFTYHHTGVCPFLHNLTQRNLAVVYLTSRPFVLVHETRKFLRGVSEGLSRLPAGPLFTSKLQTLEALYQEVVAKTSGDFKTGVLKELTELFFTSGAAFVPFVAGFGNRPTDAEAYLRAGVDPFMIFVIDPTSTVRVWGSQTHEPTQTQPYSMPTFNSYADPTLLQWFMTRRSSSEDNAYTYTAIPVALPTSMPVFKHSNSDSVVRDLQPNESVSLEPEITRSRSEDKQTDPSSYSTHPRQFHLDVPDIQPMIRAGASNSPQKEENMCRADYFRCTGTADL